MYNQKKILALIPARGGSKGIKNKNIIDLSGKPLLAYSVEAALKSKYIDRTIVSTDSETIAEVAVRYGAQVPFIRPKEYAQDSSSTLDVVLHLIEFLKNEKSEFDVFILLQPTQPLRTEHDIDGAIEEYFKRGEEALVSISEVDDHPLLIRTIGKEGKLQKLLPGSSTCRRQDFPPFYRVNGCIYINDMKDINQKTSFNDNPVPYIMEKDHSVDIDELSDLCLADYYIRKERA